MSVTDYTLKFTPYADENPGQAVETTEESLRWFDGCEYECLLCNQSMKTRNGVVHHLKGGVHKIVNASEGEHFKTVMESSLDCHLCSVSMMRNEPQIRAHLTKSHNTTMEDYAAKYVHGIADEITHFLDAPPQVEHDNVNEDVEVPKNVMWYNRSVV